jgi:DNA mismatch endonuclease (patch repair protein)
MDIKSAEDRSRNMAAIRSKDTKPEIFFRKLLFANGFRYRKNVNYVPGHPDLYLAKYHTAIFVHGCFWHRHKGCKFAYIPKSRQEFWNEKFEKNIKRDEEVLKQLADKNIKCLIVWECTLNKMIKSEDCLKENMLIVSEFFNSADLYIEI